MTADLTLAEGARVLPRGRHGLTQQQVLLSQRGRIMQAMAEAVAQRGYPATTVADVLARAGVSRAVFYELFSGKEHCFLTAYQRASDLHVRRIYEAVEREEGWHDRLRAGQRAFLDTLAAAPPFAHSFYVEVLSGGPRALELRERLQAPFVEMKRQTHTAAKRAGVAVREVPDEAYAALVGAGDALVTAAIRRGQLERLPDLLPTLLWLDLVVLIGDDEARAALPA